MEHIIPEHVWAEMQEHARNGLIDVTGATLRVWLSEIDKKSISQNSELLSEQLAHNKHKELLRRIAHCSDMFANFREDIWGDLRDFYREHC